MENFVVVDGLKTRYIEAGRGTTVLLLHGLALGSSLEVYEKSVLVFAQAGLRAVAFDLPAFGLSTQPKDYSDQYRTEFSLKFMDALAIDQAYLVGHSNAGTGPALLALNHPNRLHGVVALAVFPLLPLLTDQKAGGAELPKNPPTIEEVRQSLERDFFNKSLITNEFVQIRHRMSTGKNFEAFLKARAAEPDWYSGDTPLWKRFAHCSVPKLYLYAKDDRGNAAKRFAQLAALEPGLNMHLIDRCSHLAMMDQADEFNRKVIEFVKR
ncbi:MAG: alpha/beta hydrolase fold protein [Deltaproteobacteria bacterium]|nr:alpha/beta hydrolase fold protein [Deltaproteobacteria bacterium]